MNFVFSIAWEPRCVRVRRCCVSVSLIVCVCVSVSVRADVAWVSLGGPCRQNSTVRCRKLAVWSGRRLFEIPKHLRRPIVLGYFWARGDSRRTRYVLLSDECRQHDARVRNALQPTGQQILECSIGSIFVLLIRRNSECFK